MNRVVVVSGLAICVAMASAQGQSPAHQANGMQVTALSGAYQVRDPQTQEWLHGYIAENPGTTSSTPAPGDTVEFHVCNTKKIVPIEFGQLKAGPPCRTFGSGPWLAWTLQNDKLVAKGPDQNLAVFYFDQIPSKLQSALKASKPGEISAFSFPSRSGATTLGIITKPNM